MSASLSYNSCNCWPFAPLTFAYVLRYLRDYFLLSLRPGILPWSFEAFALEKFGVGSVNRGFAKSFVSSGKLVEMLSVLCL